MRAGPPISETRSRTSFWMFDLVIFVALGVIAYAVLSIATSHGATRVLRVARQAAEGTFRSGYVSGVLLGVVAMAVLVLAVALLAGLILWARVGHRRAPRSGPNRTK